MVLKAAVCKAKSSAYFSNFSRLSPANFLIIFVILRQNKRLHYFFFSCIKPFCLQSSGVNATTLVFTVLSFLDGVLCMIAV